VQQTALGAANMVVYNPELEISELRNNVTSKGGTTQAALTTFIDGGLTALVSRAMKAALNRAQAIAKQNS
jgi:pyrroline-5-carboxylate reductase